MTLSPTWLLLAADGLLIIHALFIAFVIFGLIFIIASLVREWLWVRNPWFRFIHLGAIGIVVSAVLAGYYLPAHDLGKQPEGESG